MSTRAERFQSKDYRTSYVAAHVYTRIGLQVRALREQRGWTQAQLAKRIGSWQSVIARIEDCSNKGITVNTLLKLAAAFDLPIIIEFPNWDEWFAKMRDISPEALQRVSFDPAKINSIANYRAATPTNSTEQTNQSHPTQPQAEGGVGQ